MTGFGIGQGFSARNQVQEAAPPAYNPQALNIGNDNASIIYTDSTASYVSSTGHLHFMAIKFNTLPTVNRIIIQHSWASDICGFQLQYRHADKKIRAAYYTGSGTINADPSIAITSGVWYYILVSVTSGKLVMYINGTQAISLLDSGYTTMGKEVTAWSTSQINGFMPERDFIYALYTDNATLNINSSANRDLFSQGSVMQDIGTDGSAPFGQAAKIFLRDSISANQGALSGVSFSSNLTLVDGPNA